MAKINTKLIKYATQARFDIDIAKVPAVIDPKSVVFIEDTRRIYAHGKYFGGAWEDISSKPETFAPAAHKHGSITNDGKIGTSANRIIETTTGGSLTHVAKNTAYNRAFGTGENQVARGNHTHAYLPLSGGTLTGALSIDVGAANQTLLTLKSAGVSTSLGSLNGSYFHMKTDATSGFYSYQNITAPNFLGKATSAGSADNSAKLGNTTLGGLFTTLTKTTDNKLSITVGGTNKTLALGSNAFDSTAYLPLSGGSMSGPIQRGNAFYNVLTSNISGTGIVDIQIPDVNFMGDIYVDLYRYSAVSGTLKCQVYTYFGSSEGFAGSNSVRWVGSAPPERVRYVTIGTGNRAERHILIGNADTNWGGHSIVSINKVVAKIGNVLTHPLKINFLTTEPTILRTSLTVTDFYTQKANTTNRLDSKVKIAGVDFDGAADIAIPFSNLISKPTTLEGYGITDAAPKSHSDIAGANTIHHTHGNWTNLNGINQALATTSSPTFKAVTLGTIYSTSDVSVLNGGSAQRILTGGLLASSAYADASKIPANGIYSRGKIDTLSHGDSNQWNTAYGWGNHADGGYVKKIGDTMTGSLTATSFVKSGVTAPQNYLLQADGGHVLKSSFSGSGHTHSQYVDLTSNQSIGGLKSFMGVGSGIAAYTGIHVGNEKPYVAGNGSGPARISLGRSRNTHGYIEAGSTHTSDSSHGYLALGVRMPTNNVSEALRIDRLGNVGIGTTSPTEKLDVSGNVKATSFIGNASSASAVSTSAENSNAASRYILFADSASGNQALKTDTGLKYVPSTNTISATFSGDLTGNVTGNSDTATVLKNINTTFTGEYPLTVNVNGTIYSHTGMTYKGSTGELKATTFVGALSGNAATANSAGSITGFTSGWSNSGEHNANNISSNGMWYYTSNGPTTAQGSSTNDGALYSQAHSTTWVAQIAQDYRNGRMFVRGKNNGTWKPWLNILDSGNSSVSGKTITINGTSTTWVDTHRGIQNNLTSTSTSDSLSAAQGRLLANGSARDSTKLALSGGTMTGRLNLAGSGNNQALSFYSPSYVTWIDYMSSSRSSTGSAASKYGEVTSWARRTTIESNSGYGWIWDSVVNTVNAVPDPKMSLSSATGNLKVKGVITAASFSGKATSAGDADTVGGLYVNPVANTTANRLVRTNASGYIQASFINTTSGTASGTLSRVYVSQDSYLRYLSPTNFISSLGLATESYVNNIEIGGRNIAINTSAEWKSLSWTSWYWAGNFINYTEAKPNEIYTISIHLRNVEDSLGGAVRLWVWWLNEEGVRDGSFSFNGSRVYDEGISKATFAIPEGKYGFQAAIRGTEIGSTKSCEYRMFKAEKGTIPTDWTPAPEDQVSDWSTTDEASFSYIKNKPTKLTDFANDLGNYGSWITKAQGDSYYAPKSHSHSYLPLSGGTLTGTVTATRFVSTANAGFMLTGAKATIYNAFGAPTGGGFAFVPNGGTLSEANTAFTIAANKNVGIGTITPAYKLDVNGAIKATGNVTASKMFRSSDRSLKEQIKKINLSNIDKINLIEFNWKSDNKKDYGVIAQDLEVYYPELVNTDDTGMKSVNYESLYAIKIARLEERIKELEDKLWLKN